MNLGKNAGYSSKYDGFVDRTQWLAEQRPTEASLNAAAAGDYHTGASQCEKGLSKRVSAWLPS